MSRQSIVPGLSASALILFSSFAGSAFAAESSSSAPLPAALRPALYQALAKDAGPAYAIGKDGCATLPRQSLTACFEEGGVHFNGKNAPALALHLASYGRSNQLIPIKPVAPTIQANRAAYAHGSVTEWWRVLPMGFEQGFTVAKRPHGNGELTLTLAANRNASSHGGDLAWGKLSYGKLVVTDAKGKVVPATLTSKDDRILIAVNDAHAVYPLTVDPLVWIEQKVIATNNGGASDAFGSSVALDGATAFVGSAYETVNGNAGQGAVYVYNESNGTWTFVQELTRAMGVRMLTSGARWYSAVRPPSSARATQP
ncbi:MAG: FG-GAP repeat protein [Gammaproteobacteria bacterium]